MENKKNILLIILKIIAIIFLIYLFIININLLIEMARENQYRYIQDNTGYPNYYEFWETSRNWYNASSVIKTIVPSIIFNLIASLVGIIEIIISFTKKKINKYVIWVTLVLIIISLFLPVKSISDPYELRNSIYYIYNSIVNYLFR